jgi:hypothetical protein
MIVYGGGTSQPQDTDVWLLNATNYPSLVWQRMNVANQSQGPNLRMGKALKIFIFMLLIIITLLTYIRTCRAFFCL